MSKVYLVIHLIRLTPLKFRPSASELPNPGTGSDKVVILG